VTLLEAQHGASCGRPRRPLDAAPQRGRSRAAPPCWRSMRAGTHGAQRGRRVHQETATRAEHAADADSGQLAGSSYHHNLEAKDVEQQQTIDRNARRSTQLALAALLLALFANAFAMANPFPYAPFLVISYGLTDDSRAVGFYAGFVLSSFMVGRGLSSFHLGLLSDKYATQQSMEPGAHFRNDRHCLTLFLS